MRTFIAVDLPESHKKRIASSIKPAKIKYPDLKWVEPINLHITLKFLGEIEEKRLPEVERAVREVASNHRPFELQIGAPGSFDSGGAIRVLWLGIDRGADALSSIANEIDIALSKIGFKREKRLFQAHLTIARTRRYGPKVRFSQLGLKNEPLPPFTIREIVIYKSTLTPSGPIYEKLKIVGLRR